MGKRSKDGSLRVGISSPSTIGWMAGLLVLVIGCQDHTGDTHGVRVDLLERSDVEIPFPDHEYEAPVGLLLLADQVVVADRYNLVFHPLDGGTSWTVGGRGEGPGEFGLIGGVGRVADSLFVFDVRRARIATLSLSGDYLAERVLLAPVETPNLDAPHGSLAMRDQAFVLRARGLVRTDVPVPAEIMAFGADPSERRKVVDLVPRDWVQSPLGVLMMRDAFGPRDIVAVSSAGRVAVSDGVSPCVEVLDVFNQSPQRYCPPVEPVRVERNVGLAELDRVREDQREFYRGILEHQVNSTHAPLIQDLRLPAAGQVWVKVATPAAGAIHPLLPPSATKHLQPDELPWYIFGNARSEPVAMVQLPNDFSPLVVRSDSIWGFSRTELDELTVGLIVITPIQL